MTLKRCTKRCMKHTKCRSFDIAQSDNAAPGFTIKKFISFTFKFEYKSIF